MSTLLLTVNSKIISMGKTRGKKIQCLSSHFSNIMEFEWLLFFIYVCQLFGILGLYCDMSQWFHAVSLHSLFPKTILHGEAENPPSCNHSCCLFNCQTWGPWALRSLSLLEALLSLPKCFLSFTEHHASRGPVYSALFALFRQISLNEAERKLSGGPVTRCWIRWISLPSYLLILGGCSLLCCGLLRAGVYFLEGVASDIPYQCCQNTLAAASHTKAETSSNS